MVAIKEPAEAGKRKLAADADMEIWATMEKRIRKAVDCIVAADDETRKAIKDKNNWKNYPEIALLAQQEQASERASK